MDGGKDRQHKKRADIRRRDIAEVRKAEQARQAHGHGRGKNERHDARPHAGEKGLNAAVFHEVPQHGGDEQQEQERRQHDAERRDDAARDAALLLTDKGRRVHGDDAGRTLPDGEIVTGKTTKLLGASAAVLLNALKRLGGIQKDMHLISPIVIEPIQDLKVNHLGNHNPRLHMDEVLIALSISAATNPTAEVAMRQLDKLRGCEAHSTVILSGVDSSTFRKLGINVTCEPKYQTKKLYHK